VARLQHLDGDAGRGGGVALAGLDRRTLGLGGGLLGLARGQVGGVDPGQLVVPERQVTAAVRRGDGLLEGRAAVGDPLADGRVPAVGIAALEALGV